MADDSEKAVRVLYDFTYSDEGEAIEIKAGDIYRLVEKTNPEWWQVYDPSGLPDTDANFFFVPAQYVEIISDENDDNVLKALSDLDRVLTFNENSNSVGNNIKDNVILSELSTSNNNVNSDNDHPSAQRPKILLDEGEYVNLDTFREAAGIPNQSKPQLSQELIQGTVPPPLPSEGTYVKELLKGLPWDIYKEHTLGRNFYVNRETGERAWKPPRKEKASPDQPKALEVSSPVSDSSPAEKDGEWSVIPPEYEQVHDNGNIYFIHKSTQEKWKRIVDKVGRKYFHKVGSSDTLWALPGASGVPGKDAVNENTEQTIKREAWESKANRMSTFGGQSLRATKAMSTYGQLENPSGAINRSSTLPANFMAAKNQQPLNERSRSPTLATGPQRPTNLTMPSLNNMTSLEDVLEGYVDKAKLPEPGSKKKVKKNWSQVYLVLQGSNLLFYKDHKVAQKMNSPQGKPDSVASLQGAHVDYNPSKEYTSKKNTILLQSKCGTFLFHHDNEKTIREWFTRMKIVANDVSPITENSSKDFDPKDDKKTGTMRSISADDSTNITNIDKNKNMVGIRAKLLGLISRRPTQEDLYKRGIIKDAVFGSLLHELCDKEKNNVPKFVHSCIAAVEHRGLKHDGLYRISGNLAEIQRLRCTVDRDDSYNLYDEQWDVHVLTGALKMFFRELKEPVFPFSLYDVFTDAIKKESRKDKLALFKSAVADLPRCNYHTLKELFQHLCKVVEVWRENRMQTQNIAIVFGPTLLWQKEEGGSLAIQTIYQKKESRKDKLALFKSAVADLPRCNYHTLKELFQHLCKVVEVWRENRMQTQNIAIVFGPTLLWQKEEGGSLAIQTIYQSKIVEFMLLEYSELFKKVLTVKLIKENQRLLNFFKLVFINI
ncbi:Rho GTPase-activating protein 12 [Bulinus truncatus]|nr:Rho GTPase-activating protein 12 [Bulinus truncatus]